MPGRRRSVGRAARLGCRTAQTLDRGGTPRFRGVWDRGRRGDVVPHKGQRVAILGWRLPQPTDHGALREPQLRVRRRRRRRCVVSHPSTGWANLGGLIGYDLAVTTDGDSLYVAGVGGDQALWTRRLTGSTWSGWQSLGGAVTSPAAGTFDDVTGTGYLFAVGADGAIWYQGVTGGVWSGWYGVGGLAPPHRQSSPRRRARRLRRRHRLGQVAATLERDHLVGLAGPWRRVHLQPVATTTTSWRSALTALQRAHRVTLRGRAAGLPATALRVGRGRRHYRDRRPLLPARHRQPNLTLTPPSAPPTVPRPCTPHERQGGEPERTPHGASSQLDYSDAVCQ